MGLRRVPARAQEHREGQILARARSPQVRPSRPRPPVCCVGHHARPRRATRPPARLGARRLVDRHVIRTSGREDPLPRCIPGRPTPAGYGSTRLGRHQVGERARQPVAGSADGFDGETSSAQMLHMSCARRPETGQGSGPATPRRRPPRPDPLPRERAISRSASSRPVSESRPRTHESPPVRSLGAGPSAPRSAGCKAGSCTMRRRRCETARARRGTPIWMLTDICYLVASLTPGVDPS